jgi:hypothetical protein
MIATTDATVLRLIFGKEQTSSERDSSIIYRGNIQAVFALEIMPVDCSIAETESIEKIMEANATDYNYSRNSENINQEFDNSRRRPSLAPNPDPLGRKLSPSHTIERKASLALGSRIMNPDIEDKVIFKEEGKPGVSNDTLGTRKPSFVGQFNSFLFSANGGQIESIKYLIHPKRMKPLLAVTCNDGTVRTFRNEQYKCAAKCQTVFLDPRRKEEISKTMAVDRGESTETVHVTDKIAVMTDIVYSSSQYVLSITDQGTLIIYDMMDPNTLLMQINLVPTRGKQGRGRLIQNSPVLKILDDQLGIGMVSFSNRWSIFSLASLLEWSKLTEK